MSSFSLQAEKKGIELIVQYNIEMPTFVFSDQGRLRQVLTNLLSNAIKFNEGGYVLLSIKNKVRDGIALLRFQVEDSGIGIPEESREHIFEKFNQVDNSSTRKYGGTGLGLTISKKIVELMKGQIGCYNLKEKGCCFWIECSFPIDFTNKEKKFQFKDIKKLSILIVDDNEVNCTILHETLLNWGIQSNYVLSSDEALNALRRKKLKCSPYDIAILDNQMPGMTGFELGKKIKQDSEICDTFLIMLTSVGDISDANVFLSCGFSAYHVKPITPYQLAKSLESIWNMITVQKSDRVTPQSIEVISNVQSFQEAQSTPKGRALLVEDCMANQTVLKAMLEQLNFSVNIA